MPTAYATKPEKMFLHEVSEGPAEGMYVKSLLHGTLVFKEIISEDLFFVEIDILERMCWYLDEGGERGDFVAIVKTNFHYAGTVIEEPSLDLNWIEELDILHTGVLVVGRVINAAGMGQMENIRWVILWEEGIPNPVVEFGLPFTPPP